MDVIGVTPDDSGHLSPVTQWVKIAWKSIDPKMIVKSFEKCSISNNNMDGTEDDIIWDNHDNEYEMTNDVSGDEELHDDLMTDAQLCQIWII